MDVVDVANRAEQDRLKQLLYYRAYTRLPLVGVCHNCLEILDEGCFCDAECRDDYEKRQQRHLHR